jgi:hypothetical protein
MGARIDSCLANTNFPRKIQKYLEKKEMSAESWNEGENGEFKNGSLFAEGRFLIHTYCQPTCHQMPLSKRRSPMRNIQNRRSQIDFGSHSCCRFVRIGDSH